VIVPLMRGAVCVLLSETARDLSEAFHVVVNVNQEILVRKP